VKQSAGNDEEARQTKVSQQKQQAQCNLENGRGGLGTSASQGESARDVENETDNPIRQKRDSSRFSSTERGKTFGGILSQLIVDTGDQLADYRSKIEKLENRLLQLQQLYEQLQAEMGEDEDEELPDEVQVQSEEE
jgi:archaellum component FlaC